MLETNDDTISLEDAASGYKGLLVIERCFRSLKRTQIEMTPMYHWLAHRIEAHVRICVLALLIERVAELACSQSWFRIRRTLDALQATKFHTPTQRFFSNERGPTTGTAGLQIPRNPATQAGSRHYRAPQPTLWRVGTLQNSRYRCSLRLTRVCAESCAHDPKTPEEGHARESQACATT